MRSFACLSRINSGWREYGSIRNAVFIIHSCQEGMLIVYGYSRGHKVMAANQAVIFLSHWSCCCTFLEFMPVTWDATCLSVSPVLLLLIFDNCLMTLSDKHVTQVLPLGHKLLQALISVATKVWGIVVFGVFSLVVYFLYSLKQVINSCVSAALTNSTEISWSQLSDLANRSQFLILRKVSLLFSCMCRVRLLES